MAWTDFTSVGTARQSPILLLNGSTSQFGASYSSQYNTTGGSNATTAVALGASNAGSLWQRNLAVRTGNAKCWLSKSYTSNVGNSVSARFMLIDRLSHQGQLSGIVTTEQTTNLPTAALTRYTDGIGVMIGLQPWTQVGSTQVQATIRYTNSDGTGNRTTQPALLGGNTAYAGVFIPATLQDGDIGVKSVEGVTLSASTGTAGSFGVVLYRPVAILSDPQAAGGYNGVVGRGQTSERDHILGGVLSDIHIDACLDILHAGGSSSLATIVCIEVVEER